MAGTRLFIQSLVLVELMMIVWISIRYGFCRSSTNTTEDDTTRAIQRPKNIGTGISKDIPRLVPAPYFENDELEWWEASLCHPIDTLLKQYFFGSHTDNKEEEIVGGRGNYDWDADDDNDNDENEDFYFISKKKYDKNVKTVLVLETVHDLLFWNDYISHALDHHDDEEERQIVFDLFQLELEIIIPPSSSKTSNDDDISNTVLWNHYRTHRTTKKKNHQQHHLVVYIPSSSTTRLLAATTANHTNDTDPLSSSSGTTITWRSIEGTDNLELAEEEEQDENTVRRPRMTMLLPSFEEKESRSGSNPDPTEPHTVASSASTASFSALVEGWLIRTILLLMETNQDAAIRSSANASPSTRTRTSSSSSSSSTTSTTIQKDDKHRNLLHILQRYWSQRTQRLYHKVLAVTTTTTKNTTTNTTTSYYEQKHGILATDRLQNDDERKTNEEYEKAILQWRKAYLFLLQEYHTTTSPSSGSSPRWQDRRTTNQRTQQQQKRKRMTRDFPLEHFAAVLLPLLFPLFFPFLISWIKEYKRYTTLTKKKKQEQTADDDESTQDDDGHKAIAKKKVD